MHFLSLHRQKSHQISFSVFTVHVYYNCYKLLTVWMSIHSCTVTIEYHQTVQNSAENLTLTGIQYPDRPARSELLYRLRYQNLYKSEWTPLPPIYLTTLVMCAFLQC